MMRKSLLFVALLLMSCMLGCDSADDIEAVESNPSVIPDTVALSLFNDKLIELNDEFQQKMPYENIETRGFWKSCLSTAAGSAIDAAGGVAGKYIGRYAGAAVGSLTANPMGTFVGYIGGAYAGRKVGSFLTSVVWDMAVTVYVAQHVKNAPSRIVQYDGDSNIRLSVLGTVDPITSRMLTSRADSIGFLHNKIMCKVHEYYVLQNRTEFDFDKFYAFVRPLLESELKISINIHRDFLQYENLKLFLARLYDLVLKCLEDDTIVPKFIDEVKNLMCDHYPLTAVDKGMFESVIMPVAEKLSNLSVYDTHAYASSLQDLIKESAMSGGDKVDVGCASMILINSALIWR